MSFQDAFASMLASTNALESGIWSDDSSSDSGEDDVNDKTKGGPRIDGNSNLVLDKEALTEEDSGSPEFIGPNETDEEDPEEGIGDEEEEISFKPSVGNNFGVVLNDTEGYSEANSAAKEDNRGSSDSHGTTNSHFNETFFCNSASS